MYRWVLWIDKRYPEKIIIHSNIKDRNIVFHKLPVNEERQKVWIHAVKYILKYVQIISLKESQLNVIQIQHYFYKYCKFCNKLLRLSFDWIISSFNSKAAKALAINSTFFPSHELINNHNQSVTWQKVLKNPMLLMTRCSPIKISKTKSLSS